MQHRLKYIYLLFTLLFLVARPLWAVTDLMCNDMNLSNTNANFTNATRWICPALDSAGTNTLNAVLSDVDVETGKYTCEYHYIDSGSVATSCTYLSADYKDEVDDKLEAVRENVASAIEKSTPLSEFNKYYDSTIGDKVYTVPTDTPQNIEKRIDNDEANANALWTRVQNIIKGSPGPSKTKPENLTEYFVKLNQTKGRLVELYNYLGGTNKTYVANLKQNLDKSYEYFVKPYISGEGNRGGDNTTFSNFITQIVTLDSEIISGYNDKNGKLKLNLTDEFNASIKNLKGLDFKVIKKFFTQENTRTHDLDTSRFDVQKWADIFEQRIWGFYYNVQRRFDIGYDIISTQLLFIMMVFFSVMMAVRGGARYIINRENGESSGEVKINEASIMKTLGILATVFAFYISVPTQDTTQKSNPNKYEDIRTNASLAKVAIRSAMKQGSDFGTMMADLGTDAFLHYIVSRQGLDNFERNNVIGSMMSMVYYFPAMQFVNTCRMQYGTEDNWVGGASNSVAVSSFFARHKDDIPLIRDNSAQGVEITGLSDRLCRKMYARTAHKLTEVDYDFEALLAMIQKDMYVRMNATSSLVNNHIKLQKDLGWMNIASIPYTYFMMKNMHLFFTASVDYEKITEQAQKFTNNLGLRDSQDSLNSTLWAKDIKESESRVSSAVEGAKHLQSEYTRYAVYNFLPGFTSIRNEVLQRVQSLYSDILRIQQSDREHQSTAPLNAFRDFLKSMVKKAEIYARGSKIKSDEIIKLVNLGIPDGNIATQNPVELHQAFIKLSYMMAMAIWKNGFIIIFLSAIAMIVGLKIVLYIINIMVHFFISPFIVVWAFATSPDGGASKIKNYLRDTLIYMLYPTIIVIGVFMFIFAYELFYSIYGFITSVLINGQEAGISNAILAANPSNNTYKPEDGEMAYLAVYALKDITEILIDLLSVYVAFLTINKFPELVLKMMGVGDSAVIMLPQSSEAIQSKGGGSVSPLSR